MEDLEAVIEEIDVNKDGKVDIDEFIGFMHGSVDALQMNKNSQQYRSVLALKAQRRYTPDEFMNYFEKMSVSALYVPSFIAQLHQQAKNLPSESFKLVRDTSGIGYLDIHPMIGKDGKPSKDLEQIIPHLSGYIILQTASGVPIPDPITLKRENIVNRIVKVGFFDNKSGSFVYGTSFVSADWTPDAEDEWTFNSASTTGTNPLVIKWLETSTVSQIDIIFEFVSSIK